MTILEINKLDIKSFKEFEDLLAERLDKYEKLHSIVGLIVIKVNEENKEILKKGYRDDIRTNIARRYFFRYGQVVINIIFKDYKIRKKRAVNEQSV